MENIMNPKDIAKMITEDPNIPSDGSLLGHDDPFGQGKQPAIRSKGLRKRLEELMKKLKKVRVDKNTKSDEAAPDA